jgi:hypothetical protein
MRALVYQGASPRYGCFVCEARTNVFVFWSRAELWDADCRGCSEAGAAAAACAGGCT